MSSDNLPPDPPGLTSAVTWNGGGARPEVTPAANHDGDSRTEVLSEAEQAGGSRTEVASPPVFPGAKATELPASSAVIKPTTGAIIGNEQSLSKQPIETELTSTPAVINKTSWAQIVNEKPSLSKHTIECLNSNGVVEVPEDVLDDPPLWEDLLIGQFITNAPHVAKIHMIVNKIWPLGNRSIKIDVFVVSDKIVKFRIKNPVVRARVLRRGMWNIADVPMMVSKWTPLEEEAQPEIKIMPLWVTIKNVPHSMFSWKGLSFLATPVGEPKKLHPETETCKNFDEAKVFVEVDMSRDLPKQFKFALRNGKEEVVTYSYPWLPPRCTNCRQWGHLVEGCKVESAITILKRGEPIPAMTTESQKQNQPQISTTPSQCDAQQTPQKTTKAWVIKEKGSSGTEEKEETAVLEEEQTVAIQIMPNHVNTSSASGSETVVVPQESTWTVISPNKASRQKGKATGPNFNISPTKSRFSVLESEERQDQNEIAMDGPVAEVGISKETKDLEEGELRENVVETDHETEEEELEDRPESIPSKSEDERCTVAELRSSIKRNTKKSTKAFVATRTHRKFQNTSQSSRTSKRKL